MRKCKSSAASLASSSASLPVALWLVLLAAGGTYALTMGTRQTMGLFLSPLNTATGLGIGSISLAFAFDQLWWGRRLSTCRFARCGCPVPQKWRHE